VDRARRLQRGPAEGLLPPGAGRRGAAPLRLHHPLRLYERLFNKENPLDDKDGSDVHAHLNPDSLEVVSNARVEPSLAGAAPLSRYQFERMGYFCVDRDSTPERPVFNRTIGLRDSWAKLEKKLQG
jgi:glutaminyl-tRNA synthetase